MGVLALTLLLVLVVGALLDRGLLDGTGSGPVERFGRALLLGLGTCGTLSCLLDAGGLGVSRLSMGAALAVVVVPLGMVALGRRRRPAPTSATATATGPGFFDLSGVQRAAVAGLVLLALVGLAHPVVSGLIRQTFQFDALVRWMLKTKALHFDGTLFGPISTEPAWAMTHQRYPPLVAHVANLPGLLSGTFDDRLASAVYPWYAVGLVAVAWGTLRRRAGLLTAALGAMWLANLPLVSFVINPPPGSGAASAMADVPLAAFTLAATVAAMDAVGGRRDRAHLECGLLLAFALLTKNEGTPLLAGCALGLLVAAPRSRWRRVFGVCGVGLVVYLLAWGAVASGLPASDEHYAGQLRWDVIVRGVERLGLILPRLGRELVSVPHWNVTWPAVGVLLILAGRRAWSPPVRFALCVVVVQVGAYVLAYMITRWESPAARELARGGDTLPHLMNLTLGRLLLHVAPVAIVAALTACPIPTRREGRWAGERHAAPPAPAADAS